MSKKEKTKGTNSLNHTPLESLILNYKNTRYPLVKVAVEWAKVLKRREGNQYLRNTDVLEMAIKDIITGTVDVKTIEKEKKALLEAAASATNEAETKEKPKTKEKEEEKKETTASKKKK